MDGDLDVSRAIYLVLYLFLLIAGMGGVASTVRRRAEPPGAGRRGWMQRHPWAVYGAVWGLIIWSLLAGRDLWLHAPPPGILTLPVTVAGGFGVGWLLTLMHGRRD